VAPTDDDARRTGRALTRQKVRNAQMTISRRTRNDIVEALPVAYFVFVAFIGMIEDVRDGSPSRSYLLSIIGMVILILSQALKGAYGEIRARFREHPTIRRPTAVVVMLGALITFVTLWLSQALSANWTYILPVVPLVYATLTYCYFRKRHPGLYGA